MQPVFAPPEKPEWMCGPCWDGVCKATGTENDMPVTCTCEAVSEVEDEDEA